MQRSIWRPRVPCCGPRSRRPTPIFSWHRASSVSYTHLSINAGSLSFDASSRDFRNRYNLYASFQNTDRKSYYGSRRDPNAYGTTHDLTVAAGGQYVRTFDRLLFMPSELTLGAEYSYNDLLDESLGYDHRTAQTVHIVSAYLPVSYTHLAPVAAYRRP